MNFLFLLLASMAEKFNTLVQKGGTPLFVTLFVGGIIGCVYIYNEFSKQKYSQGGC